jgi:hypothetical protein
VYYVDKKVLIDSDEVVMHILKKPYMSRTCPCHLARDVHPCTDVHYQFLKIIQIFWDDYGSKL